MTQFGKYQIIEKIGEGATSDVFLAVDSSLNREVALKLLKPTLVTDATAFDRFKKEARVAAILFHYNIATVYEIGEINGRYLISMRYIKGRSLDDVLKEDGPQPQEEVLKMAGQMCDALNHAHQQGFVHRDIKSGNIIQGEDGKYVLTDFGLVRAMINTGLSSHTSAMIGTPAYMAPEVWEGRESTPATDQYALACVVYEMLTGKVLFAGETPPAVMKKHFDPIDLKVDLTEGKISGFEVSLTRALARNPEERFSSVDDFFYSLKYNSVNKSHQLPKDTNKLNKSNRQVHTLTDSEIFRHTKHEKLRPQNMVQGIKKKQELPGQKSDNGKASKILIPFLMVILLIIVIFCLVVFFMPASWWCVITFDSLEGCSIP